MSPKGKCPWIELNGKVISDSHFIILHLEKHFNQTLDVCLTPEQQASKTAISRMLEDHLYFSLLHFRWIENFPLIRKYVLKFPFFLDLFLSPMLKSNAKKRLYLQGLGRFTRKELCFVTEEVNFLFIFSNN